MDGYVTSIYTVAIGALSDEGLSAYYSEPCASVLASTYVGGLHKPVINSISSILKDLRTVKIVSNTKTLQQITRGLFYDYITKIKCIGRTGIRWTMLREFPRDFSSSAVSRWCHCIGDRSKVRQKFVL